MYLVIVPNNKLSNHYRKKKTERTVWVEDQTFSSSFRQNMETMQDKNRMNMFYEDYLCPSVSFSNNYLPNLFGVGRYNMDSSYLLVSSDTSMSNDVLNNSMMNTYNNSGGVVGVEGINNFGGGDIRGLGENNGGNVFVLEYYENGNSIINHFVVDETDANDDYTSDVDSDDLYFSLNIFQLRNMFFAAPTSSTFPADVFFGE